MLEHRDPDLEIGNHLDDFGVALYGTLLLASAFLGVLCR